MKYHFYIIILLSLALAGHNAPAGLLTVNDTLTAVEATSNLNTADSIPVVDGLKLGIITGATAGIMIAGHIYNSSYYWTDNGRFHVMSIKNEYDDALLADKFGHYYLTYAMTKNLAYLWEWTGLDSMASILISGGISVAMQTYVEIQDGFSYGGTYLGFSFGDFFANILGATYAVAEKKVPEMKHVNFKVSLQKSENYNLYNYQSITKDYESRYNWVCFSIDPLLPKSSRSFLTRFVNLAVGFSVKDIDRHGSGYHELFLGLDWNIEALPGDSPFLRFIKSIFNVYHLPAPAVRLMPNLVWYGLKL